MVPNLRIGIMAHGDYCDKTGTGGYTLRRMYKLSNDPEEIHEFMSTCAATGGGDADECYELVLQKAREMKWSKRASCKTLVLIGDANPHPPSYVWNGAAIGIDWRAECAGLKQQGIKVRARRHRRLSYALWFVKDLMYCGAGVRRSLRRQLLFASFLPGGGVNHRGTVLAAGFSADHVRHFRCIVSAGGAFYCSLAAVREPLIDTHIRRIPRAPN
jgi:hypothetical protein